VVISGINGLPESPVGVQGATVRIGIDRVSDLGEFMFKMISALWDIWKERQEKRWRDQLLETETDKEVEAVRSSVMDTNVNMILKRAELTRANAKLILVKSRQEENNESNAGNAKGESESAPSEQRDNQGSKSKRKDKAGKN